MGSSLQFTTLLEEGVPQLDPANYFSIGSHNTFELMVRALGRTPTPSSLVCSLFSGALGLLSPAYLEFLPPKGMENSGQPLPCVVDSVRYRAAGRLALVI